MAKRHKKRCGCPKIKPKPAKLADFDQRQLAVGTRHELEHTTSRWLARRIAAHHLAEDPNYYRKLRCVETASGPAGCTMLRYCARSAEC